MLHPITEVHWLDINSGHSMTGPVSELFQKYIHKNIPSIRSEKISTFKINLEDENVKITDLFGWTQILEICKYEFDKTPQWYKIAVANREIVVDENAFIPVYDDSISINGFHGEIKYLYVIKNPGKITPNDKLRIHRGIDSSGNEIEFSPISTNIVYESEEKCAYMIHTKSRYGNAGHISIHMSDYMTMHECKFSEGNNYR